jgi:hypothetical protein
VGRGRQVVAGADCCGGEATSYSISRERPTTIPARFRLLPNDL